MTARIFHCVKKAFGGYRYPNYDIKKMVHCVCKKQGWGNPVSIHFYTGIPKRNISPEWHNFWRRKLEGMKRERFYRPLFYSGREVASGGSSKKALAGREKGIDVRLALDITRAVSEDTCDVVVIFSQDQDFSEVAKEVRYISNREGRWIKIASAFRVSSEHDNNSGINYTYWIRIDKKMYDECIDPKDCRLV